MRRGPARPRPSRAVVASRPCMQTGAASVQGRCSRLLQQMHITQRQKHSSCPTPSRKALKPSCAQCAPMPGPFAFACTHARTHKRAHVCTCTHCTHAVSTVEPTQAVASAGLCTIMRRTSYLGLLKKRALAQPESQRERARTLRHQGHHSWPPQARFSQHACAARSQLHVACNESNEMN